MTKISQDLTIYTGDAGAPQFTVLDQNDAALNISSVSDIIWNIARTATSVPVLVKKKSVSAGITFVTNGADGKFQVNLTGADTAPLSGFYLHEALLVDATGNQSTVSIGRLQVGRLPAWSYSGDPHNSAIDTVRFLIGDTDPCDPQLEDPEIAWAYEQIANPYGASAICCQSLATKMSRLADQSSGQSKLTYSDRARAYQKRAREFETIMTARGTLPYAGGIDTDDMQRQEGDVTRVDPVFQIGQDDNLIPVSPSGHEHRDFDRSGPE